MCRMTVLLESTCTSHNDVYTVLTILAQPDEQISCIIEYFRCCLRITGHFYAVTVQQYSIAHAEPRARQVLQLLQQRMPGQHKAVKQGNEIMNMFWSSP